MDKWSQNWIPMCAMKIALQNGYVHISWTKWVDPLLYSIHFKFKPQPSLLVIYQPELDDT